MMTEQSYRVRVKCNNFEVEVEGDKDFVTGEFKEVMDRLEELYCNYIYRFKYFAKTPLMAEVFKGVSITDSLKNYLAIRNVSLCQFLYFLNSGHCTAHRKQLLQR